MHGAHPFVDVAVRQDDFRVRVGLYELVDEKSAGYVRYGLDRGLVDGETKSRVEEEYVRRNLQVVRQTPCGQRRHLLHELCLSDLHPTMQRSLACPCRLRPCDMDDILTAGERCTLLPKMVAQRRAR